MGDFRFNIDVFNAKSGALRMEDFRTIFVFFLQKMVPKSSSAADKMMHLLGTFEYIKLTLYAMYLNQIHWYECFTIWKSIPIWLILILYFSYLQLWRIKNPSFENGGLSDQHWRFFCKKWCRENGGLSDQYCLFFCKKWCRENPRQQLRWCIYSEPLNTSN